MMTDATDQFERDIYNAYDRIEMDEMTQNRMLNNLRSTQRQREAEELDKTAVAPQQPYVEDLEKTVVAPPLKTHANSMATAARPERAAHVAPVASPQRKRPGWQVWLPIAAVVTAALIVVGVRFVASPMNSATVNSDSMEAKSEASEDAARMTEASPTATESQVSYDAESMADESYAGESDAVAVTDYVEGTDTAPSEEYSRVPATFSQITLDDGTQLTVLQTDGGPVAVDTNLLGDLVGEGVATNPDEPTDSAVSCEIYQIQGDPDTFAACYEGAYWLCVRS